MLARVSEARLFAGFCSGLAVLSGAFLTMDSPHVPAMALSFAGLCAGMGEVIYAAAAKQRLSWVTILATIANAIVFALCFAWNRA